MPLEPPRSLSPSKVTSFRDCALAFRFTAIDRLPDLPTIWTVKGTLVHRVLERLFWNHPAGERTPAAAAEELDAVVAGLADDPDVALLGLDGPAIDALRADAAQLVRNYFELEDPDDVDAVGIELTLEARLGDLRLRGILDRLDRTPAGDLVVVDYKTGRAPSPAYEQARMVGVHTYAVLCEEVLGERPVEVRLLHLKEPTVISARPTEQTNRGQRTKTLAVWSAIERACATDDFRPRRSPLCAYCRFRPYCPEFGGDPAEAVRALAPPAAGAA